MAAALRMNSVMCQGDEKRKGPEMGDSGGVDDRVSRVERVLADWLHESGGARVDIDMVGIGLVQQRQSWLTIGDDRVSRHLSRDASFAVGELRKAQALPGRGAWTVAHVWMNADDGVLHGEYDWMSEPVFLGFSDPMGARPGPGDCDLGLRHFPRDPEFVPEWMARGVAEYERREAANARRRERRRAKKAEAARKAAEAPLPDDGESDVSSV